MTIFDKGGKMSLKLLPVMRGLVRGFIIALVNGFSLPILFELFVLVSSIFETGRWYGPIAIAELWFIQFVFGFGCSLLPNLATATALSVWLRLLSLRRMHNSRGTIWIGVGMGIVAAVWYVLLLFFLEPVMNIRDHSVLAALILVEEMSIYAWIASRWRYHGGVQE
jgi:hypothetical protein